MIISSYFAIWTKWMDNTSTQVVVSCPSNHQTSLSLLLVTPNNKKHLFLKPNKGHGSQTKHLLTELLTQQTLLERRFNEIRVWHCSATLSVIN